MKERMIGYLCIFLVYVLAAGAALGVYFALGSLPLFLSLLIADVVATAVVFLFSLLFRNASVYDPYWSVQPIVILIVCAVQSTPTAAGILLLVAVLFWGIRLTANWAYTFRGLKFQDWRYTMLAEKTGKLYPIINFLGIHLVPTLVVYACVLPAVYVFADAPAFQPAAAVFFVLCIFAAILQGTADVQMHRFRKRKTGGFIREGLWKYCRHPNYLGEILMWWCVGIGAVCLMPQRWYLLAGALCNTLLFLCVSIPMADKHQARKEGFASYRRNTRMLLPLYKKQTEE